MSITVTEAGRIGGLKVLGERGHNYFSQIGIKGQKVMRAKHPGMASLWGKLGGRPKKLYLCQLGGAVVKKIKEDADPPIIHHSPSTTISPTE
jgi:hypothetical protein